jgi:hypothetical protein
MMCVGGMLFYGKWHSTEWIPHILFIHLPVNGHLSCTSFLAVRNKSALNICVQVIFNGCMFSFLLRN